LGLRLLERGFLDLSGGFSVGGLGAVIDLLEALNVTRSVRGVSRAAGPEPGTSAWKFRQRVPHLTLPWDYAIYLLASSQGALGFHFVARQSRGSVGTLISLVSPAAAVRDRHPLLQLVSSARTNQLRLDYRAGPSMEPASLLFPGGSPLARGRWARLALDLQPHRLVLFVDCRPAVLLEKGGPRDALSLLLPLDLQITFDPGARPVGGNARGKGVLESRQLLPDDRTGAAADCPREGAGQESWRVSLRQ
uniref:Thrombospondin-like N-terminal domain-containing protein n=1 Tax=Gopherus agassizii TaxID=38772 RepID=A0A452HH84_9SAUR